MKRLLRWCGYLVLAGACVIGALYVAHGLDAAAEVAAAKEQAAEDLAAALPASELQADRDRDRMREQAHRLGRPSYSWQELVCALDSQDAGLMVQHYTQECRIRSVDLIPAPGSGAAGCEWVDLPQVPTGVTKGPASALAGPDPTSGSWCPDGILEPPSYAGSRLLDGARPDDLDASPAWFVVEVTTPVSSTILGCDPWALPFCQPPVDAPLMGT